MDTTGPPPLLSGSDKTDADVYARDRPATTAARHPSAASPGSLARHFDRDAFSLRLQQHYHQHALSDAPFLLIAMRADGEAARSVDFRRLYETVRRLLGKQDDWFVDPQTKRLIVLLAQGRDDDAHRFFARLKQHLLRDIPQQAEAYLHAVTAIVVPEGGRFQNAEDFLATALEES